MSNAQFACNRMTNEHVIYTIFLLDARTMRGGTATTTQISMEIFVFFFCILFYVILNGRRHTELAARCVNF